METVNASYKDWISDIKTRIRQSQIKASIKVNEELLRLYWSLGKDIVEKQMESAWGSRFFEVLSRDLKESFPQMKGFSPTNLKYMKRFYTFYSQYDKIRHQVGDGLQHSTIPIKHFNDLEMSGKEIRQRVIDEFQQSVNNDILNSLFKVPWRHHIYIMTKCKDVNEALFYVNQTIENNWSQPVLANQIDTRLIDRQGKAITNFQNTLPAIQSDLAQQITKEPYIFDFLFATDYYNERELEGYLTENITKFLLELGTGFTYYGKEVKLTVNNDDFYIDLLFYHTKLHCYVVVELKAVKFKPEHVGQLKFYVTAIDERFKTPQDNPTIGLLICKDKNDVVAEYTLKNIESPIGVSSFELQQELMKNYQSSLPTIEEIEQHLKD